MLSDEEKQAIEIQDSISILENTDLDINNIYSIDLRTYNFAVKTVVNIVKKQSKEIEEIKEERKSYAEEYIHNNPWLYKQLNENYILRVESEQKERKAYIKGTNDAHELCNKKWEDKTKAKIEEIDFMIKEINQGHLQKYTLGELLGAKIFLESLLEKE